MIKNNVKIIVGSHGSGKSNWIYNYFFSNAIKKDAKGKSRVILDKKFYLVVPEQDTNEKQRFLMKYAEKEGLGAGILNMDVVSFDRLAHNVFDILNIEPEEKNVIDDDAKTMMLALTLSKLNKEGSIHYYNQMINKVGFARKLTQVVSEFYSYRVKYEDIDRIISESDNARFNDKLKDLQLIYDAFKKDLDDKHFSIKEDKYNVLADNIDKVNIFDNAVVAFDGFTGFTPVQLDIFRKIAIKASEVYVTIDARCEKKDLENFTNNINDTVDVFHLSKVFINDLSKALEKSSILLPIKNYIYTNSKEKYNGKEDLAYIEKNIYNYFNEVKPIDYKNIEVFVSKNADDEVKNVVDVIKKLVTENDYTYNDIKIVVPNITDYQDRLLKVFNKENIPLFIDDTTGLLNSPYIETIRSAIDVINYDFSYDSVMRYINAGIIEKTEYVNMLDNLILKYGIRGYKRYKNGFDKIVISDNYKDKILRVKDEIFSPLFELYESIRNETTAIEYLEKINSFIEKIQLDDKFKKFLDTFDENAKNSNDYRRQSNILNASFQVTKNTFNNIRIINKNDDSILSLNDFKKILDIGFTEKGVKSIPYLLDQVVVGDLMRSRFDNPKVEIFIGLNQSKIPKSTNDVSLIDDYMRAKFAEGKTPIKLSQTTEETTLNQRFYIYLALTNPTEKLILSYPRLNVDGDSDEKSSMLVAVEKLFIGLAENEKGVVYVDEDGHADMFISDENINNTLVKKLINEEDREFSGDVTAVETFNSCPYKYFLQNTMGIAEREIYDISEKDMGTFFHRIMQIVYSEAIDYKKISDNKYVERIIDRAISKIEHDDEKTYNKFFALDKKDKDFYGSNKLEFVKVRVKKVLVTAIQTLSKLQEDSKLKFARAEEKFSRVLNGNSFNGIIDRQEEYKENDKLYISIIDYKSGKQKISIDDILAGVKIQLITYLDYCVNAKYDESVITIPCGSFYFRIADPTIKIDQLSESENIDKKKMEELAYIGIVNNASESLDVIKPHLISKESKGRLHGFTDKDGFSIDGIVLDNSELNDTIEAVHEKINETIKNINDGVIKIKPYNSDNCNYCPYISICRKDQKQFITNGGEENSNIKDE